MTKLINFLCHNCNKDFTIQPYFNTPEILIQADPLALRECYTARVAAKAVCPWCGTVNVLWCKNDIFSDDIINLATRKYAR